MSYVSTFDTFANVRTITPGQRLVLAAISTFTNKQGTCFPSLKAIAERTSLTVRSVQRHLASLISLGFIERVYRAGRSALTRINLARLSQSPALDTVGGDRNDTGGGDKNDTHNLSVEPIKTIPAAPPAEPLPAAVSPPSLFSEKTPEQPKTAIEPAQDAGGTVALPDVAQANAGQSDAPDPTANELTADTAIPAVEVVDVLADVPATLLADLGEVRKAKKKPAKVTRTEAQILKTEAEKAGWTLEQVIVTMICHGWSRFQADWVQHVPPQTRQIGQEAVFKPEVVQPASPGAVARFKAEWAKQKAQILADGARRREEMARLRQ